MVIKYLLAFVVVLIVFLLIGGNNIDRFDNDQKTPIIIYYHIAALGNWREIVREQLDLIRSSKLYDRCQEIRIGFLGDLADIQPYLDKRVRLVYHSPELKYYEIPTINKMVEFCQTTNQECYILYLHNKGSTNRICNGINGQKYWRELMNYWNIERHQDHLDNLAKGYLTSGINLVGDVHYSGNFWWTTSSYIKKCSILPCELGKIDRISAESFILQNRVKGRHISMYGPYIHSENCQGLYGMKLNRNDYLQPDVRII